ALAEPAADRDDPVAQGAAVAVAAVRDHGARHGRAAQPAVRLVSRRRDGSGAVRAGRCAGLLAVAPPGESHQHRPLFLARAGRGQRGVRTRPPRAPAGGLAAIPARDGGDGLMPQTSTNLLTRIRRDAAPAAKRLLFSVGAYEAVRRVRPSAGLAI